jgi:putative Mg2+ transporter-C (MgtC) family protein
MDFTADLDDQLWILLDIIIAAILTGAVGWEREKANKPAGLRTTMLVGSASCLLVSIVIPLIDLVSDTAYSMITTDPIRVLEAVVVGVSFIGGGVIIKSESTDRVRNLTTAASLLMACGIGVTVALKQYLVAVGVTIFILLINGMVYWLEGKFFKDSK